MPIPIPRVFPPWLLAVLAALALALLAAPRDALAQRRPHIRDATPCVEIFTTQVALTPVQLADAERDGVQTHNGACLTRVANNYLAQGQVARANTLFDLAARNGGRDDALRCLQGLAEVAGTLQDAARLSAQQGGLPARCPTALSVVEAMASRCLERAVVEPPVATAALRAVIDTARHCRDDEGLLGATAGVLSATGRTREQNRAAEVDCLRNPHHDRLPGGLTTCAMLADLRVLTNDPSTWGPDELTAQAARARHLLDAGVVPANHPEAPLVAVGLLVADARLATQRPQLVGVVYDDLDRVARHGLLREPVVLRAASELPLLFPTLAEGRMAFRERIVALRNALREVRTPEATLLRMRLGFAAIDRADLTGTSNPFFQVIREAVSADLCAIQLRSYQAQLREAAEEGVAVAMRNPDRPSASFEREFLREVLRALDTDTCPRPPTTLSF